MPSAAYLLVPLSCQTDSTFVVFLRRGNCTILNRQLYGYFFSLEMLDCAHAILNANSSIASPSSSNNPPLETNLELHMPVTPNPPTTYWIAVLSAIGSTSFRRSSVSQTLAKEPTSRISMGLLSVYSFLSDGDSMTWVDSGPLTISVPFDDFSVILASWRNAIVHSTWKCSDPLDGEPTKNPFGVMHLDFGLSRSYFDTFTTHQGSVIKAASLSVFPTETFSAPAVT
ncbi:hypothetical protein EDB80DRAFT_752084 [Ilyonectria destructans]|nr:hypothetical protein EDB80DRAFT_752084 [Ilyonectria destructans]